MKAGDVVAQRFALERKAGEGGMGTVYVARDLASDGARVALKSMQADDGADRFAREAAVLAHIEHESVVRYVTHGSTESGEAYLVMEWLEGEDLAARLARGPLSIAEALEVARGASTALAAVHQHGVVHRDVKPSNLFLVEGRTDRVKLLDLGIARSLRVSWTLTQAGCAIGTPAYMSPEQARGETVDARADVFALGCVIFECLAGRTPFHADHPVAAMAKMLVEDAPRVRDVRADVPAALDAWVARLLAKSLAARLADGDAALALLEGAAAEDVGARSTRGRAGGMGESLTAAEQRIVSVVVTRPASGTDATMHTDTRRASETRVREVAEARGASLFALANGSFVATIAGAGTPTDQAARAASCALAIAAVLGGDAVALAMGRAVVADRVPFGAAIDRAVALLSNEGGGVRVDPEAAALLETRYEIAGEGGASRTLVGARDSEDPARRLLGKPTACVGRERELATLGALFSTCIDEPLASVVLVTAPAGTGKSRLVAELVRAARARDEVTCVLAGRCDPMSAGSAFAVVGEAIRRAAWGGAALEVAERRRRLRARMAEVMSDEASDRVAELLGEISGAPWDDDEASPRLRALRGDRVLLGDAIAGAWTDWLEAECERGAVVLSLEDLHWSDLPSMRLVDGALRVLADRPLFVVGTARPELRDLFPRLFAERGVQEVHLGSLTRKASERLVRELLPDLPAETIASVAARANGHPFLLEELIRSVAAHGSLGDTLPDTVLGMIEARFTALDDTARAVLRAASVFGERFWRGAVEALSGERGERVEASLARLTEAELIQTSPLATLDGETELSFRHALFRDAAYAMLTDGDRRLGHRLAGAWLEKRAFPDPLAIAEHFARGDAPDQAGRHFHRAATAALEGNDLVAAIARSERALACGLDDEEAARVELLLAEAHYWSGDMARAEARAIAVAERREAGSDAWCEAVSLLVSSLGQRGENAAIEPWLTRAIASALGRDRPLTDSGVVCVARGASQLVYARPAPALVAMEALDSRVAKRSEPLGPLAQGWLARVRAERFLHDFRLLECSAAFREARAAYERAGALRIATLMGAFAAVYGAMCGAAGDLRGEMTAAVKDADRLGSSFLRGFTRVERALVLVLDGDLDRAERDMIDAAPDVRESARVLSSISFMRSLIACERGELAGAAQHARDALAMGHPVIKPSAVAALAHALAAGGDVDGAMRALASGPDSYNRLGDFVPGYWYLARAEVSLAAGRRAEAEEHIRGAVAALDEVAPKSGALRDAFLARKFPNARIVAIARELGVARPLEAE